MDVVLIIAQGLGFLALGVGVYAFLQISEIKLARFMGLQGAILCIHFILLGHFSGALAAGFSGLRTYLSIFGKAKPLAPLFMVLYVVFGYLSFETWPDALPQISGICATAAFFYMSGYAKRVTLLGCTVMWLIHNIAAASIGPAIMEFLFLIANCRTLFRMRQADILNKGD